MVTGQPRPRPAAEPTNAPPKSVWPTYFGIIALLVLIVVALAGGIIWYNLRKSTELMVAAAERQMVETGEKISDRIRLLYDPMYAIVGIASQAPDMKALHRRWSAVMPMLLRALRFYPQILSLYVGFDNGDFFGWITSPAMTVRGYASSPERRKTPPSQTKSSRPAGTACGSNAGYFSTMTVSRSDTLTPCRRLSTRGRVLGIGPALHSDHVELSDLYIFIQNNEPGFTLSRSFHAAPVRCLRGRSRSDGPVGFSEQAAHHPREPQLHIHPIRRDRSVSGPDPNGGDRAA